MTLRMLAIASLAALATLPGAANAQRTGKGRTRTTPCRVDSSARWYVKQREWLDDAHRTWSDDTLRRKLLRSVGLDAEHAALAPQVGWSAMDAPRSEGDSAMIAQLRATAGTRGSTWPTRTVVGAAGVRAVWMLSLRDSALARAALKRMMEAGPEESNAADVAMLEDRVRLSSSRKQIYGTQMRLDEKGTLVLAPMEDSAHVDLRREDAGLPPFKYSACVAGMVK